MLQSDTSQSLLSLLYATVTDRSKWQSFCDELNAFSTVPIMMFGHNICSDESLGIIAGGLDPVELDRYHAHFADQNPWMHMNMVMPMGAVGVSDQALARDDLFKTEFYNDWLRPQENIVGGPAMICYRSSDRFVAMAAACPSRRVDNTLPDSHRLFEDLAPHMARSIALSTALSDGGVASFPYLEASLHGIVLVRRSGRVGFVNSAADRLISKTGLVTVGLGEKLATQNESLRAYLSTAMSALCENRLDAVPEPLAMTTGGLGPCVFHTHVFPAEADHNFPCAAWADPVAGAIVITGSLGLRGANSHKQIVKAFGATPAEARLAQALVDGLSLYDYADLNKLSRHTVRNQMRVLLRKTESRNQADFVRRMHLLASPFGIFEE